MLSVEISALVGILFVLVAGANVWLMFARMSPGGAPERGARLAQWHRAGGYVYLALYVIMMYFMLVRLQESPDELGARALLHMVIGFTLAPLLFLKILIARSFRNQAQYLTPLGLILFSLTFVMVGMTAGPFLLRRAAVETISLESVGLSVERVDMGRAEQLMRDRCGRCHTLDKVVGARKDAEGWLETVNRMMALPGSGISQEDAHTILPYLIKTLGVDSSKPEGQQLVGRALVDARCGRCHGLDLVFKAEKTRAQWKTTIDRMVALAPSGHFRTGEAARILEFLSRPRPQLAAAGINGAEDTGAKDGTTLQQGDGVVPSGDGGSRKQGVRQGDGANAKKEVGLMAQSRPRSNSVGWLVIAASALWSFLLYLRGTRRAERAVTPTPPASLAPPTEKSAEAPPAAAAPARLSLTLARVIPETPTAATFRFRVPEEVTIAHRAGQFLTFDWIVDGRKVVRSYSISSSPAGSEHYLDITVKRVPDGCVSCYLHDRAAPGLTVSARPPAGKFVLPDPPPARILCLAAGSGITPVMSILRWVDHACLPVEAALLYSVRTEDEIIFGREIDALTARLPGFRAVTTVTQPGPGWTGERGRISREMIDRVGLDLTDAWAFLCGPKPFMESARALLAECGVPPERIRQELFGGPPATRAEGPAAGTGAVPEAAVGPQATFQRTGKSVRIPEGRTLLETAEMEGVAIPYSCRQGQCGTCATRLLAGEVRMDAEDGLDPDLRRQGFVLTCVGRAQGDVILDA